MARTFLANCRHGARLLCAALSRIGIVGGGKMPVVIAALACLCGESRLFQEHTG